MRIVRDASARLELAMLRGDLLSRMKSYEPGLQAAVDQHAAAVRDILGLTIGSAGPVELAAYAQGVRDAAAEHGWSLEHSSESDWVTLRLLATVSLTSADTLELPQL
ncbi:hypothetical protein FB475_6386 [Kribbella jejuensis]|uniref:Uncharacterized protein n=2 Tax=Kribbella jejuensis TaxID=236068 RepID=A0A542DUD0_9ACTN|nr:hypothetical protein FB475_6386 [Kribbella jejuensis]